MATMFPKGTNRSNAAQHGDTPQPQLKQARIYERRYGSLSRFLNGKETECAELNAGMDDLRSLVNPARMVSAMSTEIATNGLGRTGRMFFRAVLHHPELELVAVNDLNEPDILLRSRRTRAMAERETPAFGARVRGHCACN